MIEAAESVLKDFGFYDVRVRHHELNRPPLTPALSASVGERGDKGREFPYLARIEVGATELPKLLESGTAARVAEALKKIGYAHVTLDLQGYRRGSLNESNGARSPQPAAPAPRM